MSILLYTDYIGLLVSAYYSRLRMFHIIFRLGMASVLQIMPSDMMLLHFLSGEPFKQAYYDLNLTAKPTVFSGGMAASNTHIAFPWEVGGGGLITLIDMAKLGRNSGNGRLNLRGTVPSTNFILMHIRSYWFDPGHQFQRFQLQRFGLGF